MIAGRIDGWVGRIKSAIRESFAEKHTARETAGSFSLGVFITMLPTLGGGLLVFVVIGWLFERINRAALLASVIGVVILGPVPGTTPTDVSLTAGPEILVRLLVGNLILAIIAAIPSYFVCLRLIDTYQTREIDVVETITDIVDSDDETAGTND